MSDLAECVVLSRSRVSRVVVMNLLRGVSSSSRNTRTIDAQPVSPPSPMPARAAFTVAAPVYVRAIEAQFAAS